MSTETIEDKIAIRENALVRIDSGGIERTIRGVQRKLSNTRVGIFVTFSSVLTLINIGSDHLLRWLALGMPDLGIAFKLGIGSLFGIAIVFPLFPFQERLLLRRVCLIGLNECRNVKSSDFVRNKQKVEQFEATLTSINYLEEAERIEYAGRLALWLMELGEIKEAFHLMVDAQKAAMEARAKIARIWWLPSFQAERNLLKKVNPNERLIDTTLGATGELMIALFHRLEPQRIIDQTLAGPASPERLLEIVAMREQRNENIVKRQNTVLLTIVRLYQVEETSSEAQLSELWDQVGSSLIIESKAEIIPTLALLGLAKASLHLKDAKEAWFNAKTEAKSVQLQVVRSLLPTAFGQDRWVFRDHR